MTNRICSFCLLVISMLCASSCIKEVNVPLRSVPPKLVVEGHITTDSTPYSIRLSWSGNISSALEIPPENQIIDADVKIRDDQGKSVQLGHVGNGIYTTQDPTFVGEVGRSYSADITLKDGQKYISLPEKMPEPVPIDSVQFRFEPNFTPLHPAYIRAFVYTSDPGDQDNYYKWEFTSYTRRRTLGVGCGFGCVMFEYCLQKLSDNEIRIRSDQSINGNDILNQGVGNSYIFSYGSHFVEVSQVSLTRQAYQFWQQFYDQSERTGSILDPLPASIRGNIVKADNQDETALGFFSARSVTRRKYILIPYGVTQYLLDISADAFFVRKSIPCFQEYPNTLPYDPPPADQVPPPPGWENAEQVDVRWQYP